jgi:catechol 2,3-dioxygenase-like lactoylglutathione lyase family enzyme
MGAELNHTIVKCTDKEASARFLVDLLGLDEPTSYGPFLVVQLANGVSLDYADNHGRPHAQHYAFIVSEQEFDEIHARIVERGITYWADPFHRVEGKVNTNDGGRGLYWDDPDGHNLEIITVPYGGAR